MIFLRSLLVDLSNWIGSVSYTVLAYQDLFDFARELRSTEATGLPGRRPGIDNCQLSILDRPYTPIASAEAFRAKSFSIAPSTARSGVEAPEVTPTTI